MFTKNVRQIIMKPNSDSYIFSIKLNLTLKNPKILLFHKMSTTKKLIDKEASNLYET